MTDRLPDTLSGLLELAISEGRALDRDKYIANSMNWHAEHNDQSCSVCLAGFVIARKMHPTNPQYATYDTWNKLLALDYMRHGIFKTAAAYLKIDLTPGQYSALRDLQLQFDNTHCRFRTWEEADKHMAALEPYIEKLEKLGL